VRDDLIDLIEASPSDPRSPSCAKMARLAAFLIMPAFNFSAPPSHTAGLLGSLRLPLLR
jgi:hypothetical protein